MSDIYGVITCISLGSNTRDGIVFGSRIHTANQSACSDGRISYNSNFANQESTYTSASSPPNKDLQSSREIPLPQADFYETQKRPLHSTINQNTCNNTEMEDAITRSEESMKKLSMQKLDGSNGLHKSSFLDINGRK